MEELRGFDLDVEALKMQIGTNIRKLREAVGWSQEKFASETGLGAATVSNYISGKRLPGIDYLMNLCALQEFKRVGLDFTIGDLLSENFNPSFAVKFKEEGKIENAAKLKRGDFIGSYLCYFFDQTKPVDALDCKAERKIRYGVLTIYDDYNKITREVAARVIALFFKQGEDEYKNAIDVKQKLDDIFSSYRENYRKTGKQEYVERNNRIKEIFSSVAINDRPVGSYVGILSLSEHHAFINIESDVYGDNALIVLYSPQKKIESDYIGGIGSVASVAHGHDHMPTAQKIILSRYELGCDDEVIAEHLSMSAAPVRLKDEAEALCELCRNLYDGQNSGAIFFDENDKLAIIEGRLNQLVKNYIRKNICCVGNVSGAEDKNVYSLIKKYRDM